MSNCVVPKVASLLASCNCGEHIVGLYDLQGRLMCYKQDWIGGLTAGFREHEYEDSAAKVAGKDQLAEAEKSDIATEFGDDEQKLCFIDEDEKEKHDELVALPPYGSEVFIGGLPRDVWEDDLRELCEPMGDILLVRLVKDRDTGEHKRLFRRYITGNLRNVDEGVGPGVETIELIKTLRKAYGALKDSTMVSLAKVNSEYKEMLNVPPSNVGPFISCQQHMIVVLARYLILRTEAKPGQTKKKAILHRFFKGNLRRMVEIQRRSCLKDRCRLIGILHRFFKHNRRRLIRIPHRSS
ncbi:hypothetical protein JHK82_033512 [Glycine max]|nr:hypothetical protein JHK82_033512 [Glycine max]